MKTETTSTETSRRPTSRAEVEAALQARAQAIEADLEALHEEIRQMGQSVRETLWNHPLISVGGSLAAGLLVGWLLGGLGRNRRARLSRRHRALVTAYVEALVAEAQKAARRGRNPETAIRRALEERVPLVVVQEDTARKKGPVRTLIGAMLGLAGSALSAALSRVLTEIVVEVFAEEQKKGPIEEAAAEV
ncbi:hypothetical protein [Rhodothermus profundi]|uniref:DUF3618 domain-containing protein n=1 Tax=Rhodothermus profundi TaxID=633813 RepID=A0A1M6Q0M7_9BACT|nr:hypothetical protein [Rhodothermus profundi]SHK13734.1 hypothetical protein SAMN04488087_0414 [Rhodothermus profundi]